MINKQEREREGSRQSLTWKSATIELEGEGSGETRIEYCFLYFIVRFLYHIHKRRHFHRITLIAVFVFSSLNLPSSSDPSISAQNSRDRASNMQICHAQVRFDFSQKQARPGTSDNQRHNNNLFTISIYLLPSEESDRKSYKKKLMRPNGN